MEDINSQKYYLLLVVSFIILSEHCQAFDAPNCSGNDILSKCQCAGDPPNVTEVYCFKQNLTSIPEGIPPCQIIRIQENSIHILEKIQIDKSVQYLYLINNQIRYIRDDAFTGLFNVEVINLASNEISSLRIEMFEGLGKLKSLMLSNNPLHKLQHGTFQGPMLPMLEHLYLSNCSLYAVEDAALDTLNSLITLDMSYNNLVSVPSLGCPGHSLDSFISWDLSHNKITQAPRSNCSMAKLDNLYLNNNNLRGINATFLGPSITHLQSLHLRANKLTSISPLAFHQCQDLSVLDISVNNLSIVESNVFNWSRLHTVLIHDNPWECSCTTSWLVDKLPVAIGNSPGHVRCAKPDSVYNKSVTEIDQNIFQKCGRRNHVTGIVIGVVLSIIGLIGSLIICFLCSKRRNSPSNSASQQGASSSRPGSMYKRMGSNTDVTFSYDDPDRAEPVAAWSDQTVDNHNANLHL